jgi:hypothetical protein
MDVIKVLDFFSIEKRSETLNGSIPLRAAQGCKPLLDGNSAGFHLRLTEPAVIRKSPDGAMLVLTDEGYEKATEAYSAKIEQLIERGLLVKGGYWHKELNKGFGWQRNHVLYIWTGYLVRPASGVCLLVSGAFNRRCLVNLIEYVIADDASFVPLILQLDLSSLRTRETWLDTELACLVPMQPNVSFSILPLKQQPEVGQAWCDFYDPTYLEPRGEGKYIGRYRKFAAVKPKTGASEKAECQLIVAGGPNIHKITTFDRFVTRDGRSRTHPTKHLLQFAVVGNMCDVKGRWDNSNFRDISAEVPHEKQRFRDTWIELYGEKNLASVEWLMEYAHPTYGPHRGEPYFGVTPWVFAVTPPGWSSVLDGFHLKRLDGMRGVIATDTYFGVPPLWQIERPGRLSVSKGTPLARVLPVPRHLLHSTFQQRLPNGDLLNQQ